jgi:hypothetical protein
MENVADRRGKGVDDQVEVHAGSQCLAEHSTEQGKVLGLSGFGRDGVGRTTLRSQRPADRKELADLC